MQTPILIETDNRSRVVLPGRPNERFLLQENADGSLYLEPALVVSAAQREYDTTPALQELLTRATASKRVTRRRSPIAR